MQHVHDALEMSYSQSQKTTITRFTNNSKRPRHVSCAAKTRASREITVRENPRCQQSPRIHDKCHPLTNPYHCHVDSSNCWIRCSVLLFSLFPRDTLYHAPASQHHRNPTRDKYKDNVKLPQVCAILSGLILSVNILVCLCNKP
mmetsp:Transcript_11206/g.33169  ORF Transcript_11206/g.33169 Transcript_11206/m.33169 type:complete len:144 (+) Transcript_11206:259-690(+)